LNTGSTGKVCPCRPGTGVTTKPFEQAVVINIDSSKMNEAAVLNKYLNRNFPPAFSLLLKPGVFTAELFNTIPHE
jgi:hypothetical protein